MNTTIVMLQLTLSLLNAATGHQIDRQAINALVNQSVQIAALNPTLASAAPVAMATETGCIQWCDPIPDIQPIVAPTSSAPVPQLEVLPVGSMYSVFNQPKY